MKSLERVTGLIGLLLMAAFLIPYILKMPQLDLIVILLGGLGLAAYDYISPKEDNTKG